MFEKNQKILSEIFEKMSSRFGPQRWWPGETPFEVMVGAVLTQNTNWTNVEKAILNLKQAQALSPHSIESLSEEKLAQLIRPAGYFNVKAKRLKNLVHFLIESYAGNVESMKQVETMRLREELLAVNGIGPETADSILLYALEKPVFVIDQYTYRLLTRHHLISEETTYSEMQDFMSRHVREDLKTYNEFHAQIVRLGKEYCRTTARCEECPLNGINW